MKKSINKLILFLFTLALLTSCDNFDRTEVIPAISVNHSSLNLFIGSELQLVASPQNNKSYTWESEQPEIATVSSSGLVVGVSEGSTFVIVRDGDIHTRIPVFVEPLIPLTNIELDTEVISPLFRNETKEVLVFSTPENANDVAKTDFKWWSDNESVAFVNDKGKVTGVGEGVTEIHYQRGNFLRTVKIEAFISLPFKGPHILSKDAALILPARDFDLGGEGNGYHDSDKNNSAGSKYRADNGDPNSPGVDIEGGGNLGYVNDGEWLLYTVEVKDAGVYSAQLGASGNSATGSYYIEVDGVNKTGLIDVPHSGSWSNWKWHPEVGKELTLTEGKHTIKLYIKKSGFNINELKFEFLR